MPSASQQHEIPGNETHDVYNRRHTGYAAHQAQQVITLNPCAQEWSDISSMDIRFVGTLTVNHLRQRALVVMTSASAEPVCPVAGADVTTLGSWESNTPANFGGDGHRWWKVCYVVPDSGDEVDFSLVTGAMRFAIWFTCEGDLPSGVGQLGGGVAILHSDALEYTATFGTAHAEISVSQACLPKDAAFFWLDGAYRTIDDLTFTKIFHNEDSSFDHDETKFNAEFAPIAPGGGQDSSIDWTTDNRGANEPAMTFTMQYEVDAVASVFPGACRVVATGFGASLRALCIE